MNSDFGIDKVFINRLTSIVEANLADENFGVKELADKMRMNRSSVHRKLKSITKKSVSEFIREIRLQKAKQLLEEGNDTISEVAYKVGFGSPSYFSKCFHDYFGFAPAELKRNQNQGNEIDEVTDVSDTKGNLPIESQKQSFGNKIIKVALGVFLLLIVFFLIYRYSDIKTKNFNSEDTPKSIAVLPLKNLSNDSEMQYLADGIMEDILTRLSYIDGLIVKSRISGEKAGDEKLSASEIAQKLNVSYLLEGSIIPDKDKIRINVQLISAREDKHVWAEHFDSDLTGVLPFITEISRQITDKLELILTPREIRHIEKIYTENKEAYRLYLDGLYYFRLRTPEYFEKSIELYKNALELDSNFCLAYAGLADAYINMACNNCGPEQENVIKSRANALKALSIDADLALAHATLGAIAVFFDHDWGKAEKELKLAMKLNSGYARSYTLYSQFMLIIGNIEEARNYINKALEIDPNYPNIIARNITVYSREGNYDKVLEQRTKLFRIDKDTLNYTYRKFIVYLQQNKMNEAVEEYKRNLSLYLKAINWDTTFYYHDIDTNTIDSIYAQSGKEGFLRLVINIEKAAGMPPLQMSQFYAMNNEKDSALTCLEKAYEDSPGSIRYIKENKDYKKYHAEPRFIELLRKMNLTDEQIKKSLSAN
ncbi:MAG TPA: helix-turn-helix domain-containing protein [Draconibacterium sp.]|nr:helix-turn-helix domain-containing protein [Draconibacterium sp.]